MINFWNCFQVEGSCASVSLQYLSSPIIFILERSITVHDVLWDLLALGQPDNQSSRSPFYYANSSKNETTPSKSNWSMKLLLMVVYLIGPQKSYYLIIGVCPYVIYSWLRIAHWRWMLCYILILSLPLPSCYYCYLYYYVISISNNV